MATKFRVGQKYESIVCAFYTHMGFELVDRNVNYNFGEIDLVLFKDFFVFVEVKSTHSAEEAFDLLSEAKLYSIHSSVEYYCLQNIIYDYRIDYCCVLPSLNHAKLVFARGI